MRMGRRADAYRSEAKRWRLEERQLQKHLDHCRTKIEGSVRVASKLQAIPHLIFQEEELAKQNAREAVWWRANAVSTEEKLAYSSMMWRKYEYAARFPWLEITEDPPVPYWSGTTGPPDDETFGSFFPVHLIGTDERNPQRTQSSSPDSEQPPPRR
jgi:hypothetical protein